MPSPSFFFFFCSCNVFSARHRIGKDGVKLAKAKVCHIKYLTFSTVVSLQRKRGKGEEWDLTQGYEERPNVCRIKYQMLAHHVLTARPEKENDGILLKMHRKTKGVSHKVPNVCVSHKVPNVCVPHKVPNACSSSPRSKTGKRKGWDFTQNTQKDKACHVAHRVRGDVKSCA